MVIGGVCLPVRFAGFKQGAEEIKEQTRVNNISVNQQAAATEAMLNSSFFPSH